MAQIGHTFISKAKHWVGPDHSWRISPAREDLLLARTFKDGKLKFGIVANTAHTSIFLMPNTGSDRSVGVSLAGADPPVCYALNVESWNWQGNIHYSGNTEYRSASDQYLQLHLTLLLIKTFVILFCFRWLTDHVPPWTDHHVSSKATPKAEHAQSLSFFMNEAKANSTTVHSIKMLDREILIRLTVIIVYKMWRDTSGLWLFLYLMLRNFQSSEPTAWHSIPKYIC